MRSCLRKTIVFFWYNKSWYVEIAMKCISRGMLLDHISGRNTCKQTQMHPQRHGSIQLVWMETESQNKMEELLQKENYAELILFARILLLAPDCPKRCVSNHTLAKIPLGCVHLYSHFLSLWTCVFVHVSMCVSYSPVYFFLKASSHTYTHTVNTKRIT